MQARAPAPGTAAHYANDRMREATPYNYRHFSPASWRAEGGRGPSPGQRFPDLALTDADGNPFRMSELRGKTVVLETGSLTSPLYVRHVDAMAALKERFPAAVFLVLYVREEHPGRRLPEHRTFEEKRAHARALYSEEHEHRRVLVDDLAGSAHKALGGLPNMVFVIDEAGIVRFTKDWSDPAAIEAALAGKPSGEPSSVPPRPSTWMSLHVLFRAGFDAFMDFVRAFPSLSRLRREEGRRPTPQTT